MTNPHEQREGRGFRHVIFELIQDSDGWPPVGAERVWASEVSPGLYKIDNIPFYVRGISRGDVVSVSERDGALFYKETIRQSGHGTVRVIIKRKDNSRAVVEEELRKALVEKGCEVEGISEGFFAVDIPPTVSEPKIISYLREGEQRGDWEYEEGNIIKR